MFRLSAEAELILSLIFNPMTYIVIFVIGLFMLKTCKGALGQVFGILFVCLSVVCGTLALGFALLVVYG